MNRHPSRRGGFRKEVALPIIFRQSNDESVTLKSIPHGHFAAVLRGEGDLDALLTISFRLQVGYAMAGFAQDRATLNAVLKPALAAMASILERYQTTSRVGGTGNEYKAIGGALALTDDLQDAATRREQRDSYKNVQNIVGAVGLTVKYLKQNAQ